MSDQTPIVVVRKKAAHGGHHGGAWKVAYADFVTAMMAFFLVLWLVGQGKEVKAAVGGYFRDPVAFEETGGRGILPGSTELEEQRVDAPPVDDKTERARLEEAVTHIKRLGGSELSGIIDVPTVGRMQMLKDPQGAAFYIIQPTPSEERPEGAPQLGEASWHELMTTDAEAAMKFYSEVFGWQPSEVMDMGPMGKYHMFNRPVGMIGGMMNKPPEMANVPPNWGIYFLVSDINAAVDRVKTNGGQILNGPMEVPGGDWIVNAMDPQGAAFSLHAKKSQ